MAEGPRTCYRDALRGLVADCRAAYLNMNAIDKYKKANAEVNWTIWDLNKEI